MKKIVICFKKKKDSPVVESHVGPLPLPPTLWTTPEDLSAYPSYCPLEVKWTEVHLVLKKPKCKN